MTLDQMLDINQGYENFKESVLAAYELGHISSKEVDTLLHEVGTYVNSTVIMSSFTDEEARRLLMKKIHHLYMLVVVLPGLRGDKNSGPEYFEYRLALVVSASDLIKSAIKRALLGREREKVYRSISANVIMGQEGEGPNPFERDRPPE